MTSPDECPCRASYDSRRQEHYVWIAFLHSDNDERERGCLDALICFFDRTDIIHTQIVFYNHVQRTFVTFSIDARRNHVFASTRKLFRRGWSFVRVRVTAAQEVRMYDFFLQLVRDKVAYDPVGPYASLIRPIDNGGHVYFCSQLAVAALQVGGFLANVRAYAVTPAGLHAIVMHRRRGEFADVVETPNPVLE